MFYLSSSIYETQKEVLKSRNRQLVQFFENAVGIHHAGMLRADRGLTERLFSEGLLKVSAHIFLLGCYFSLIICSSCNLQFSC